MAIVIKSKTYQWQKIPMARNNNGEICGLENISLAKYTNVKKYQ